jgi:hypothetical protein
MKGMRVQSIIAGAAKRSISSTRRFGVFATHALKPAKVSRIT